MEANAEQAKVVADRLDKQDKILEEQTGIMNDINTKLAGAAASGKTLLWVGRFSLAAITGINWQTIVGWFKSLIHWGRP